MAPIFRLLGPLEISSGEGPAAAPGGIPAALLGLLLLTPGRWVGGERLEAALWPEADPERARHSLHVSVSSLRRALQPHELATSIESRRGGYRIAVDRAAIDLFDFRDRVLAAGVRLRGGELDAAAERLAAATELCRGRPFEGMPSLPEFAREAAAHDEAEAELEVLRTLYLLRCGSLDEAERELGRALQAQPTSARLWEGFIRVRYHRDGAEPALAAYRDAHRALGTSPRLQRLEHAIRARDDAYLAIDVHPDTAPAARARREARDLDGIVALVDRALSEFQRPALGPAVDAVEDELDAVSTALADAWATKRYDAYCSIAHGMRVFCWYRGYLADGLRWVTAALARSETTGSRRVAAHWSAICLLTELGVYEPVGAHAEAAVALAYELDDPLFAAHVAQRQAAAAIGAGELEAAERLLDEASAVSEAGDDPTILSGILHDRTVVALARGRTDEAVALSEEAIRIARTSLWPSVHQVGGLARARAASATGAPDAAEQALAVARSAAAIDHRVHLAAALELLACDGDPSAGPTSFVAGLAAGYDTLMGRRGNGRAFGGDGEWRRGWNAVLHLSAKRRVPAARAVLALVETR